MQDSSDEQLIAGCLKGDKKSLEFLFSRHLKPVYNFVYRFVGNAQEAEDIVQETFIKAWRSLKKFDKNKKFKTWIYRIAKNTAIDFLRKKKPLVFSSLEADAEGAGGGVNRFEDSLADPLPLPDELFDRQDLQNAVTDLLNKLPAKYSIVLLLHYQESLTFQEIADSLEESVDTVKSRHRRALIRLRGLLLDAPK